MKCGKISYARQLRHPLGKGQVSAFCTSVQKGARQARERLLFKSCWPFQVLVFSTCVQRICKAAGQWKATAAKGVNSAMFKFVTKKTVKLPIKPWKVTSTAGENISSNTPAKLAAFCITEKEICQPEKCRAQSFQCWGRPVCFHWWILANCPAMSFVLVLDIPM